MLVSFLAQIALSDLSSSIKAIMPSREEEVWLSVPWRTNLMAARLESQEVKKPMFLWVMNGHPMGCT
ncbi:MAG: hypothetical protein ABL949_13005 [Fimbriimonadaceae bacterium]